MEILYKIIVILSGLILLIVNLIHIAKKKMDVGIGTSWTIMSVVIVLFGIIFDFSVLNKTINVRNAVLIYIFAGALVIALYLYGLRITELKNKSNDMAIWVSIIRKDVYQPRRSDYIAENAARAKAGLAENGAKGENCCRNVKERFS